MRELRVESRNRAIYHLRMMGTAWLLGILWLGWPTDGLDAGIAARLFAAISLGLFVTIWMVVPMITSDCLSHERREGTLGLLFLTPLTAFDVVAGKGLAHALRAGSLILAALPVLVVPTLLGGVGWMDVTRALLLNLSALMLAIAAGLVASAWCRDWRWALALAVALSGGAGFLFLATHGAGRILSTFYRLGVMPSWDTFWIYFQLYCREHLLRLPFWDLHARLAPGNAAAFKPPAARADLAGVWLACALLVISVAVAVVAVLVAARHLRGSWMDRPPSRAQWERERLFCSPRFWLDCLRRKRRQALEYNPVGWLAQYSWRARLIKWGWLLVVAIMETWLRLGNVHWQTSVDRHEQLGALLLLTLAANSAVTFHAERRAGAFELLLVSPLRPAQIAWGRMRGLVMQVLPAGALLVIGWADFWPGMHFGGVELLDPAVLETFLCLTTLMALPAAGLYCSLRLPRPLLAWLATCGLGLLPVLAGAWLLERSSGSGQGAVTIGAIMIMTIATQFLLASTCLRKVIATLERRTFTATLA